MLFFFLFFFFLFLSFNFLFLGVLYIPRRRRRHVRKKKKGKTPANIYCANHWVLSHLLSFVHITELPRHDERKSFFFSLELFSCTPNLFILNIIFVFFFYYVRVLAVPFFYFLSFTFCVVLSVSTLLLPCSSYGI